jgi:hypothetical protein
LKVLLPPSPCLFLFLCIVLYRFSSRVFVLPFMWSCSYAFSCVGCWSINTSIRWSASMSSIDLAIVFRGEQDLPTTLPLVCLLLVLHFCG